jgi:hypothetical protein
MTIYNDGNPGQIQENINNIRNFGNLKNFGKNDLFKQSHFLEKSDIFLIVDLQISNLNLSFESSNKPSTNNGKAQTFNFCINKAFRTGL